jgi:hypothetical protein
MPSVALGKEVLNGRIRTSPTSSANSKHQSKHGVKQGLKNQKSVGSFLTPEAGGMKP